jgi:hypothetical protein
MKVERAGRELRERDLVLRTTVREKVFNAIEADLLDIH